MEYDLWGQLLFTIPVIFILLGLNAFFAASEMAMISLNKAKINLQAEEGDKKAKLIKKITDEPSKFLATIQVGVTFAGFFLASFVTLTLNDKLGSYFVSTNLPVISTYGDQISIVLLSLTTTYLSLVFGELAPKKLALDKSDKFARFSIVPLDLFSKISSPFIKVLTISSNFIIRLFGGDPHAIHYRVSEEEIRMMINVGEERGILLEQEKEMIDSIFEFDDTFAKSIMTPRIDMVCVAVTAGLDEIISLTAREKFSRLPVYEGTIDNVIGILNVKDLLEIFISNREEAFCVKDFIRQPLFVPENQKTHILLKTLQEKRTELAIVIDEYGGTAGLVTSEDLVEEIVGSIMDEYDEEERGLEKIDENTYVVDGMLSISEINREIGLELPEEGADTIAGFVLGIIGRVPKNNETPSVEYENLIFTIEHMEDRRALIVRIDIKTIETVEE